MLALQIWIDFIVLSNVTPSVAEGIVWTEEMWSNFFLFFNFLSRDALQESQPFFLWILFIKTMVQKQLGRQSIMLAKVLKVKPMV